MGSEEEQPTPARPARRERAKLKQRGVYCIETVWYEKDDQTSMRPVLELLRDGYLRVPFIHRTAITKDEFTFYVKEWLSLPEKEYPILYLGYHGESGSIDLGGKGYMDETELHFHDVGARLADGGGCNNRAVHFASCSTLDLEDEDVGVFLEATGASAVSGYSETVDWFEAATFDMLFLKAIQLGGRDALTPVVMRSIRDGNKGRWGLLETSSELGASPYYDLATHLGFRLEVA